MSKPQLVPAFALLATLLALIPQVAAQTPTDPGTVSVTGEAVTTTFYFGPLVVNVRAPDPTPPHVVRPGTRVVFAAGSNFTGLSKMDIRRNEVVVATTDGTPWEFMATAADSGSYRATITLSDRSQPSNTHPLHVAEFKVQPLVNVSTRTTISPANPRAIIGFVVPEAPLAPRLTKNILLRAVGPSLAPFGVSQPLARPTLTLYNAQGRDVTPRYGFLAIVYPDGSTPFSLYRDQVAAAAAQVGAFPLPLNPDPEFAELAYLPAGAYTAIITSADGGSGEMLFEAYDIDPLPPQKVPPSPVVIVIPPTE